MKQYYVYILTNITNKVLYTGMTDDLIRRVYEHKNHLAKCSFTDKYNVTKLVYFETTTDVTSAIQREKQVKKLNRARKDDLIKKFNPKYNDLYFTLI